jgi:hypothetical protein
MWQRRCSLVVCRGTTPAVSAAAPTFADRGLVDQGRAPPGQAARVLASLRAAPRTPKTYCFASSRTFIRD